MSCTHRAPLHFWCSHMRKLVVYTRSPCSMLFLVTYAYMEFGDKCVQPYVQVFFALMCAAWGYSLMCRRPAHPLSHQTCGCSCPCFAGGQFVNTVYLSLLRGWLHLLNDTCVRIAGGLVRLQELRLEC